MMNPFFVVSVKLKHLLLPMVNRLPGMPEMPRTRQEAWTRLYDLCDRLPRRDPTMPKPARIVSDNPEFVKVAASMNLSPQDLEILFMIILLHDQSWWTLGWQGVRELAAVRDSPPVTGVRQVAGSRMIWEQDE